MTEPNGKDTRDVAETLDERELPGDVRLSSEAAAEIYGEERSSAVIRTSPPGSSKLVTALWALPGTLWLLIFLVAPVIVVLVVSFFTGTITGFSKTLDDGELHDDLLEHVDISVDAGKGRA